MTFNIEWDEQKARRVFQERGVTFEEAAIKLLTGPVFRYRSQRQEEERYVGIVEIHKRVWAIVHKWDGETLYIITAHRVSGRREREYRSLYPG